MYNLVGKLNFKLKGWIKIKKYIDLILGSVKSVYPGPTSPARPMPPNTRLALFDLTY